VKQSEVLFNKAETFSRFEPVEVHPGGKESEYMKEGEIEIEN